MKSLGQYFLKSQRVINKIIDAADLKTSDIVLEVGPGKGILTEALLQKVKQVIAVEKDKRLAGFLLSKFNDCKNLSVIHKDILKFQVSGFGFQDYKIVANIPYYITSRFLRKFLERGNPPELMVLMLQKEVAERITAKPPHMNLLAISVQIYAEPKIISRVSKNCFSPVPKVDSAIVKIQNIKKPKNIDIIRFFQIVKAGFSSPRKLLINNLASKLKLSKQDLGQVFQECKIPPKTRAENLSIQDWKCLSAAMHQ